MRPLSKREEYIVPASVDSKLSEGTSTFHVSYISNDSRNDKSHCAHSSGMNMSIYELWGCCGLRQRLLRLHSNSDLFFSFSASPWEVSEWELLHEPKKPMRDFGSYLQPPMGLSVEDTSLYSEQGGEQGAMGLNAQERFGLELKRVKRTKQT